MPTVEQVWLRALPAGTRLVSGEAQLYDEVTWVVTLKPYAPGFDKVRGHELVLVDAAVAAKLGISLPSLVSSLAQHSVSAVAVVGQVTAEMEQAREQGPAILQLPEASDLAAIEGNVSRLISDERLRLYNFEHDISQALMETALSAKDIVAILKRLQEHSGRQVVFVDFAFRPVFASDDGALDALLQARRQALQGLQRRPGAPAIAGLRLTPDSACFIGAMTFGQEAGGYLALVGPAAEMGEPDRMAVNIGMLALAVEMSRRQAAEETQDSFEAEIMESLLAGDFPSSQAMTERVRRLGLDLSNPHVALAIKLQPEPGALPALRRALGSLLPEARCHLSGMVMAAVLPAPGPATAASLRRLAEETGRELSRRLKADIALGLGRPYPGPEGIRTSFLEAERALALGNRLFGPSAATWFGDLGIYQLLFSLEPDALKAFHEERLGRLAQYDEKHNGQLLTTLESYLRCNTLAEAAEALHIHRNTLLYRLQRLREVSGLDLENSETRLGLHLALRAAEVLRAI